MLPIAALRQQLMAAQRGGRSIRSSTDRSIDHFCLSCLQGDRPHKEIDVMPFSVAAQRGIYMVVYGVTQKDIQLIVFDRANMGGDIIPQDTVALLNVGILQGQIVLICGGLGLRPGTISAQGDGKVTSVRLLAQSETIQLRPSNTGSSQGQSEFPGGNGSIQRQDGNRRLLTGRQPQRVLTIDIVLGTLICRIPIPYTETGGMQGRGKGKRKGNGVPFSAGHDLPKRSFAFGTAEPHANAVSLTKAGNGFFAPAQTIPGQTFVGTMDGKIQGVIILCPDKGGVFRQGHLTARQGETAVGRNGIPGGCHIMKHQILRSIGIVVELGTDQPGILPQGSKRDVCIQLILPQELVAERVAAQIRSRSPGVKAAFKPNIGHIDPAAIHSRKNGQVKPNAVVGRRNMGNTAVTFGVGAPRRQGKVM